MLTLVRWAFWLAAFGALFYFAATVPLGDKTLFEHLVAISRTKEARSLAEGTEVKAQEVGRKVRRGLDSAATDEPAQGSEPRVPERRRAAPVAPAGSP